MHVLTTERLSIRWLEAGDAPFILNLLNDPDWIRFIGDRNVRDIDAARDYILNGPQAMYARCGFGLNLVTAVSDGSPMGICGLIKRDSLDDVDIGYAFLPQFRGAGFARESAAAILEHGRIHFDLKRIIAITHPDNAASQAVLESIGLRFECLTPSPSGDHEVSRYAIHFD